MSMHLWRRAACAVSVGVLALAASACGGGSSSGGKGSGASARATLRVLATPGPNGAGIFMAQAKGFFRDAGVDVTIQPFPSGTTALQTFQQGANGRSGFGDLVQVGNAPGMSFWGEHQGSFRVIADMGAAGATYVAMARSDVRNAQDLRGKKVGVLLKSSSEEFLLRYLQANGMTIKDVKAVNLDPTSMVAALNRGDISAFFLFQPAGAQSQKLSGNAVHVLTTGKGLISEGGMIAGWDRVIKGQPKAVQAFLRGFMRGNAYAKAHVQETAKYLSDKYNVPVSATTLVLPSLDLNVNLSDAFKQESQQLAGLLKGWQLLKVPFDYQQFVAPAPLTAVAPDKVTGGNAAQ